MAEKDIGALPVIEANRLVGIFTERDYARRVILKERTSRNTPIRQVMTSPVITASPRQTMRECLALLAKHRIRHLPVMQGERLVGVVSIGDVLQEIIEEQRQEIQRLENTVLGTELLD
jgi:CBS domain-containing protein